MLINLIKLFQSAAETSNFKQACKLNGSKWKSPVSLFRITTEHYLSTLLHISGTDLSAENHRWSSNRSPTLQIQRQLPQYHPSATTDLAQMSSTRASPPTCKHSKWVLHTWEMLVCISVIVSPQVFTPSFHLVPMIQLEELFLGIKK